MCVREGGGGGAGGGEGLCFVIVAFSSYLHLYMPYYHVL